MVLKGPLQRIVLREKQKVAGIWMNVERVRFRSAPSFYAVASSRPLPQLIDERTAAIYELGLDNLQLSPGGGAPADTLRRFEQGLIDLQRSAARSTPNIRTAWRSREGVLYRARHQHPGAVPVGTYTAETFLIRGGRVVAGAARDIRIEKIGFEGFVAQAAEHWSLTYGVVCVALSLLLGWGGERLLPAPLRRDPRLRAGKSTRTSSSTCLPY